MVSGNMSFKNWNFVHEVLNSDFYHRISFLCFRKFLRWKFRMFNKNRSRYMSSPQNFLKNIIITFLCWHFFFLNARYLKLQKIILISHQNLYHLQFYHPKLWDPTHLPNLKIQYLNLLGFKLPFFVFYLQKKIGNKVIG